MSDVLFQKLCLAVRQGGALAKAFQGKVQNEGKELDVRLEYESERVFAMRTAKTLVDETVQEILLLAIADAVDTTTIRLDAEEQTPSVALFPSSESDTSIIIDPIDGTLEYLEGGDAYSVCIGVVHKGAMHAALVYFPARDVAYVLSDGVAQVQQPFGLLTKNRAAGLVLPNVPIRTICMSRHVPKEFSKRFTDAGFSLIEGDSHVQGLLQVISGEAAGYIATNPQMRDVLLAPIIGASDGGFMCDWHGKPVVWPESGRISQTFYGNAALEDEFRTLLT